MGVVGGASIDTERFTQWEFWWENNKDGFRDLETRLARNRKATDCGPFRALTGGRLSVRGRTPRPSPAVVRAEIIPALLDLVRQSSDRDILDAAILALARSAESDTADQVFEVALTLLARADLSVQTSTVLALGVLGSDKAVPALESLLLDSSDGRRLTGGGSVHWLVRSFSALSLGLIGDPGSIRVLRGMIDRLSDKDVDIKVCAIVALGMAREQQRADVVAYLVELLGNKRMDPRFASYIPTSLGKLGDRRAVQPLLGVFTGNDSSTLLLQSAAIGLGQLATVDDADVIDALLGAIRGGEDAQTRHFSIIALARIGARDADPEAHVEIHDSIDTQLAKEIQGKGKSKKHRPWAALAGAIYARAQVIRQPAFIERIEAAYIKEEVAAFKGAFALALGLLGDAAFGDQIFEDFRKHREIDFRGYALVALGFLEHSAVIDAMRQLCKNKGTTPTLRLGAATGLGLLGDTGSVPRLIETLGSAKTLGVSSAVAKALGLIGDRDSIAPLKQVAMDESLPKLTRAFACVALGLVGEKAGLSWSTRLSESTNYRARTPSMAELVDIQ